MPYGLRSTLWRMSLLPRDFPGVSELIALECTIVAFHIDALIGKLFDPPTACGLSSGESMITSIDTNDIKYHFKQLKDAGIIPDMVVLDDIEFQPGGGIAVDAGVKVPIIGTIDVKLKLAAVLLSDKKTIRVRLIGLDVKKGVELSARGFILGIIQGVIEDGLEPIPGLRWVTDPGKDGYVEYKRPQEWILVRDLSTNDNKLTLVLEGIDIPMALEEFRQAKIEQMKTSNSMADKINVKKLENK